MINRTDYDDERELTRYVWENCTDLMTDFERRLGWAELARRKAAIGRENVAEWILRTRGVAGDPEAEAALADGVETFRRRVCRRLLSERGSELFVNRCPACNCVVQTPKARQCFWCGHDWHEEKKSTASPAT